MSPSSENTAEVMISETAQVKFHEGNKVPLTMLLGRVTPSLLQQWEEYAIAYFNKAKMAETDKVSSVLTCWRDTKIDNFIKMNKEHFCAADFTFTKFMADIRKGFLDPLWQNNIMCNIINSRMDSKESFSSFANHVIAGNNLLDGTDIHLDAAAL